MPNILPRNPSTNASRGYRPMLLNSFEKSLLWTGLTLRFCLSNALLNTLYPYTEEGGMPLLKIHPGTYILGLAFFLAIIRLGFLRLLFDQFRRNFGTFQFLTVIGLITVISIWRFGFSGLAYMIDTLIAAALVSMMLKYIKADTLVRLSKIILLFILLNSVMALAEFTVKTQFMPYDIYSRFNPFRASALLGHPLSNALVTSPMLILIFATLWPVWCRWSSALIYLSAILAFGARAAFAISMVMLGLQQALFYSGRLLKGRLPLLAASMIPFVVLGILILMITLLFETNLGTRIIELASLQDNSANARFKVGTIFEYLQPDQLLWGLAQAGRMIVVDKNPYFSIIENFWVVLILNFGLVLFVPFAISFLRFLFGLVRGKGQMVSLAAITFILVASANNSLSTKTPDLIFFVCACAGIGSIDIKRNNPLKS